MPGAALEESGVISTRQEAERKGRELERQCELQADDHPGGCVGVCPGMNEAAREDCAELPLL